MISLCMVSKTVRNHATDADAQNCTQIEIHELGDSYRVLILAFDLYSCLWCGYSLACHVLVNDQSVNRSIKDKGFGSHIAVITDKYKQ